MKKYTIVQTAPAVQYWTYEVIANSEEEALMMVNNGDVDEIDYTVDGEDPAWNGELYVQSIKEINE